MEKIEPLMPGYLDKLLLEHDFDAERRLREMGRRRDVKFISCKGLVAGQVLMEQMRRMLHTIQAEYQYPVDTEFTINISDNGEYSIDLLQCRPLQIPDTETGTAVPEYIPEEQILLESKGASMGLTGPESLDLIVYVDAVGYYNMPYNQMKCHVGVDAGSGLVHTITVTPANVHDINEAHKLLREDDEFAYGDNGYSGIEKRDEIKNDEHLSRIDFRINCRPKSLPKVSDNAFDWEREIEHRKSSVRCKVEHAFKIIKDTFGFRKVRYKGLAKNLHKLNVLFACANLLMVKRGQLKSTVSTARG